MNLIARDYFYGIYRDAGLVPLEQSVLNPDEEEEARRLHNRLCDLWRMDGFNLTHIARMLFPVVANQMTYTIGPGGNWDTDRPVRIERASIILIDQTLQPEYPLTPLTVEQYQTWIVKKQLTQFPWTFYYDKAYSGGLGNVVLLYGPTQANEVALYLEQPLGKIAVAVGNPPNYAAVTMEIPDGYEEPLSTNVALRALGRMPSKSSLDAEARMELKERAAEGQLLLKQMNNRPLQRTTDLGYTGTRRSQILLGNRYYNN